MMSIRWRILGAFLLVILLTVVIGTGFDYWSGAKELSDFSTRIRTEDLADVLGRQYTADGGWKNLDGTLTRYGAKIDPEKLSATEAEKVDLIAWIPWRVVVKDTNGDTLADTFEGLDQASIDFQLQGEPVAIRNMDTREEVGTVTVAINQDFVNTEAQRYLTSILVPRLIQGLITAIIAMVLGFWLSRRITVPVSALTEATKASAKSGEATLLPVNSSDELGQMSASFNQMMTSLETQRELRKRLIDDVAHELSTPLSIIRLEAKGLQDGIKPSDEAADQIMVEIDLLSNLVYDLSWLAETDSGALRLKLGLHNLGKLITTEVERWQLQAQAANIELKIHSLPEDLPFIEMDAGRISQALGNLIENALQHTPQGGHITVQCESTDDYLGTVRTELFEISICDTGPGIPDEDLPYIFERFYRVDPSRQKESGGRGLGLAIVKKIVEAHQGKVWVESESGKGCCFYFSLPL